jgi:hypothetical protein
MTFQSQSVAQQISPQEKQRIRTLIHCLGKNCGVDIEFAEGQRVDDIFLLHLQGNTSRSLELYDYITQALPRYGLLLLNSKTPERFGLEAAIVQTTLDSENDPRRKNILLHQFKSSSLSLHISLPHGSSYTNHHDSIYELVTSLAGRLSVLALLAPGSSEDDTSEDDNALRFYLDGDRDVLVKLFGYVRESLKDADVELASNQMPNEEEHHFIEYTIGRSAQELDLQIAFEAGKRRNDIVVMRINGDLRNNLELYRRVSEDLPEYAIQLFNLPAPEFGARAALVQKSPMRPHDPERRTDFRSLSETTQW